MYPQVYGKLKRLRFENIAHEHGNVFNNTITKQFCTHLQQFYRLLDEIKETGIVVSELYILNNIHMNF